jgi:dephospho-CoA kinase
MGAGIRRIGLTGGIGSGKSTVANVLVALGAHLVDTDAIAREITAPGGAAIAPLRAAFGDDMVDASGALDRARMRALAFGSAAAKAQLEAVLHPMIGQEAQRRAAQAGDHTVVFDVPLLGEHSVWRQRCERILVVDCSAATQIERVMQRSGWPREQVQAVIAQQLPREHRLRIADAVIHNDGIGLQALQEEVRALSQLWQLRRQANA